MTMLADGEFELVLYGADGSEWPLAGDGSYDADAAMLEGEVSQLYLSPYETTYRARVGGGGAMFRGARDLPARFPLRVGFRGPHAQALFARFRRALRRDRDAVLEFRSVSGGMRRLTIREEEHATLLNEHDPGVHEFVEVEFPVIAPVPYWESAHPLTAEWEASPGRITGELVVSNPGEVSVWPRFICTAPAGWVLPDVDHDEPADEPRMIAMPFLPYGRDALVDTDPLRLTVEAVDETLAPLAGLRGAHFIHPIPEYADEVRLPVAIDPMPGLQLAIPDEWKAWITVKLQEAADAMGVAEWTAMTPTQVGERVHALITGARPAWLPDLSEGLLAKITAQAVADAWASQYGRWGVVEGATVQIQIRPRWRSPW